MIATIQDVKDKAFDYIICGGGTAGLTLAARLSEDPNVSVLVLEAGEANVGLPELLRPAAFVTLLDNPQCAWDFTTIKQKGCGDTTHKWPRGKGLGGSSGINFMCWMKPARGEVDDFERLGNPGWNWNNFAKYITRTEGFIPPGKEQQNLFNMVRSKWDLGTHGPLAIGYPKTMQKAELKLKETMVNAGIAMASRPLNGDPAGTFFTPCNYDIRTNTRSYATTAYYLPNKDRPNLIVLVCARVNRILPSCDSGRAFSAERVEFEHEGKVHTVSAKREIILSAGALKSPQILELSGIGNPNILRKIGIPTKVPLPGVGRNVQEHMTVALSFELRDDVVFDTYDILMVPEVFKKHVDLYRTGAGLFTSSVTNFTFATLHQVTPRADEIIKAAEDKIMKNAASYPPGLLEQYKISLERLRHSAGCEFIMFPGMLTPYPNTPVKGKRYVSVVAALNYTFSRGTIHSTSKDPAVNPEFDPHYLEEEIDLQVWVEMVKFMRNLKNVAPLRDMITKELNPGPNVQTDEEIAAWIKAVLLTTWHTASSCSMLPQEKGGVVDPQLKVYGTRNLRVVDLSIVPLHFAAHTQAMVYGMAEQAADIIKGKFQTPVATAAA
ncbi:GMC oxidoreductase [Cubamyces sp. BRFM 1775]|nr:GMC oxidoreductase [Cubamyces sp. BRFM 1775]